MEGKRTPWRTVLQIGQLNPLGEVGGSGVRAGLCTSRRPRCSARSRRRSKPCSRPTRCRSTSRSRRGWFQARRWPVPRCYRLREIVGIRPIRKCRRIPGTVRARGGNTCSWCCRESMPCAAGRRATEEWSDRTSKKIPKKIHFHTGYSPALSDQRWHEVHVTMPDLGVYDALLADQAAQGGWSHVHYLDELAAVEAVERAERRIARLPTVAAVLGHATSPPPPSTPPRSAPRPASSSRACGTEHRPPHSAARPESELRRHQVEKGRGMVIRLRSTKAGV